MLRLSTGTHPRSRVAEQNVRMRSRNSSVIMSHTLGATTTRRSFQVPFGLEVSAHRERKERQVAAVQLAERVELLLAIDLAVPRGDALKPLCHEVSAYRDGHMKLHRDRRALQVGLNGIDQTASVVGHPTCD